MRHSALIPLPASPPEPDPQQMLATQTFLAGAALIGAKFTVQLPAAVAEAGYRYPPKDESSAAFWSAIERALPSAQGTELVQLLAEHGDRLMSVRLRYTGEQRWALSWYPVADRWVNARGDPLLPVPANDQTTSAVLDADGVVLAVGDGYASIVGEVAQEIVGRRWPQTLAPESAAAAEQLLLRLSRASSAERLLPSLTGQPRWLAVAARHETLAGAGRPVLALQIEDLARADQDYLAAQLIRDPLTGLYNRRAFLELAELAASATTRFSALLVIDVRRFKQIIDLSGQPVAERCLVEAASWLQTLAAADDLLIWLAGGRFLLLSTDESPAAAALAQAGERDLQFGKQRILLSLQAGWAAREPGSSLLVAADRAATALDSAARQAWRAVVPWTEAIGRAARTVAKAENAVHQAVAAHQEAVHFQPIVDLAAGRVSGMESLVRMAGPAADLPRELVLAASHQLGLTPRLAERVYDLALGQGMLLRTVFPGCLLGVNVSREFLSTGLAIDIVLRSAARAEVPPDQVMVELTEQVAAGLSTELLVSELTRGADSGLNMVIDDFGRGDTSLSLLRKLPVSGIKLDRSMLPLDDDDRAWDFLAGTVSLLTGLTNRLIAEGIETALQSRRLRAIGVHVQQGYFFGQPAAAEHWLRAGLTLPPD